MAASVTREYAGLAALVVLAAALFAANLYVLGVPFSGS